jgi:hypothetical protein
MPVVLLTLAIVVVAVVLMWLAAKPVRVAERPVTLRDIPAIFERLHATKADGAFAVFIHTPADATAPDGALNLQFSIEGGRIGLDWVLLGQPNLRDREQFVALARKRGHVVVEQPMEGGSYLRTEAAGLPELAAAVLREMYAVTPDTKLDLIPEGFAWP